jgi:uncharacterized protein (DUF433 family)
LSREIAYLDTMTAERRAILAGIVTIDKEIMHGTPCFSGTRVPVQTLLDFIEGGDTLDKFLEAFPRVQREQAVQFLEMAKEQLLAECASF